MRRTLIGGLALMLVASLPGCSGYYRTSVAAGYESPEYHTAVWYYRDGMRLYRMGYYDRARIQFELAIEENPSYWEAHYYLGDCYYRVGYYDRSLDQYNLVINLQSDPVWVSKVEYNIGVVYEKTGRYSDAGWHYDRSLKVKPNYGPAKQAKSRLIKYKGPDGRQRGHGRGRNKY